MALMEREKIMRSGIILSGLFLSSALMLAAQTNAAPPQAPPAKKPAAQTSQPGPPDRGQVVFNTNCSRCHNAPEGFSPRISGTVAKHMRDRATLSDEDYQALMHFLNP